ncbi:smoothelin [Engraulis encrasicolus]|uniref:smoothelin n=1 Tax=Engraulis encrasicolus TaxID=184585 RepID=UPI002FD3ECC3
MEAGTDSQAAPGPSAPLTSEQLAAIDDEQTLSDMLDKTEDFDQRRLIRAAMRDLLKRKREQRERERGSRQKDLQQQQQQRAQGKANTGQRPPATNTPQQKTWNKTVSSSPSSPKSPGSPGSPSMTKAAPCFGEAAVPNSKNVKQMLLDWCRAKTEPYEGVEIHNFSSSWADGLAFCALVHRFFPDGFDYCTLDPYDRKANFEKAFKTAETLGGCPALLDVDDLLRMKEPDWKCVYTYIQEFYRCLVEKGLVKTKKKTLP